MTSGIATFHFWSRIVAAITVHGENGLFAATNGIEVPLLYAAGALAIALTGPGRFSLDAVLGFRALWTPAWCGPGLRSRRVPQYTKPRSI